MIPEAYITEWRKVAPWPADSQVEQDLVICRALVEIYSRPELAASLAFRGGTALHKLHFAPAHRYSEDIDLVQLRGEAIGPVVTALREALDPWLGEPKRDFADGTVTLIYRFRSEGDPPLPVRLKVEINSREHFSVYPLEHLEFSVASRWFTGKAQLTTFKLEELLGTKLRALYQRRKGRDLFDLSLAIKRGGVDFQQVIECFGRYLDHQGVRISRAEFEENLHRKRADPRFRGDMQALLVPGTLYDPDAAMAEVLEAMITKVPGAPLRALPK